MYTEREAAGRRSVAVNIWFMFEKKEDTFVDHYEKNLILNGNIMIHTKLI